MESLSFLTYIQSIVSKNKHLRMKSEDRCIDFMLDEKDSLASRSDAIKGNERRRILRSLFPLAKEYDADESSSDDGNDDDDDDDDEGISYGSDFSSIDGEDFETRCSFSDDEGEFEVFSEDEVDFDLGTTEITSPKEEDCLFYFSCESFESSFDLEEPLYTIQEEEDEEEEKSGLNIRDEPYDMIERSDAFEFFHETKEESNLNLTCSDSRKFYNFHRFASYEQPIFTSFYVNDSLMSDMEKDVSLFTIFEEPELEDLHEEERMSTRHRIRRKPQEDTKKDYMESSSSLNFLFSRHLSLDQNYLVDSDAQRQDTLGMSKF